MRLAYMTLFLSVTLVLGLTVIGDSVVIITQGKKYYVPVPPKARKLSRKGIMYATVDMYSYECAGEDCKKLKRYPRRTQWVFSHQPSSQWVKLKKGYIRMKDLMAYEPLMCKTLTYKIGKIDGLFIVNGFNEDALLNMIRYAAKEWNRVYGKVLFEYDPNSGNPIDFIADVNVFRKIRPYDDAFGQCKFMRKGIKIGKDFEIIIFSLIFDYDDLNSISTNSKVKFNYTKNLMSKVIMHEMGHAVKLQHIGDPNAVMSRRPSLSHDLPKLTRMDIDHLKKMCGE